MQRWSRFEITDLLKGEITLGSVDISYLSLVFFHTLFCGCSRAESGFEGWFMLSSCFVLHVYELSITD